MQPGWKKQHKQKAPHECAGQTRPKRGGFLILGRRAPEGVHHENGADEALSFAHASLVVHEGGEDRAEAQGERGIISVEGCEEVILRLLKRARDLNFRDLLHEVEWGEGSQDAVDLFDREVLRAQGMRDAGIGDRERTARPGEACAKDLCLKEAGFALARDSICRRIARDDPEGRGVLGHEKVLSLSMADRENYHKIAFLSMPTA